jgi:hypothetical protein
MRNRRVLILRFPALADQGRIVPVGVCEDPDTGEQKTFATAEDLWSIVQGGLVAESASRALHRRPVRRARFPKPTSEEDS